MPHNYENERERWLNLLTGDDRNSIRVQLTALSWDLAAFEIIGEAIKLAPKDSRGGAQFPPLVFNLLRVGFYSSFFISIRRLTDRGQRRISLKRVLLDMQGKSTCFTRSAMLAAEGIPYDFLPAKQKQDELLAKALEDGSGAVCIPPDLDWERFAERQATIDRLTGINKENRSPADHVPQRVFKNLASKVEHCSKEAAEYTNKFLAHAEPRDVDRIRVEQVVITHEKLAASLKCLGQVFNFLRGELLGAASGPLLPWPGDDHLAFLDRPIADADAMQKLRKKWDDMQNASLTETAWNMTNYELEFGA